MDESSSQQPLISELPTTPAPPPQRNIPKVTACTRPRDFSVSDQQLNAFEITDIDFYLEWSYKKPRCRLALKPPYPVIRLHGATESGVRVVLLVYDFLPSIQVEIEDQNTYGDCTVADDYADMIDKLLRRTLPYNRENTSVFRKLPWREKSPPLIASISYVKEKNFLGYSNKLVGAYKISYRDPYWLEPLRAICERGFTSVTDNRWLSQSDLLFGNDSPFYREDGDETKVEPSVVVVESESKRIDSDDETMSARGIRYKRKACSQDPDGEEQQQHPLPPPSLFVPDPNYVIAKRVPPKHTVFNAKMDYVQEFECRYNTTGASWVSLSGSKRTLERLEEYQPHVQVFEINIEDYRVLPNRTELLSTRVLSFDIECEGRMTYDADGFRKVAFPNPVHDPVIQIGNVFYDQTLTQNGQYQIGQTSVFVLHKCAPLGNGVKTWWFSHESDLLLAWFQYLLDCDPDIITGYNICNFDFWYLFERMKALDIYEKCTKLSNIKSHVTRMQERMVGNNAKKRLQRTIRIPGRLVLDMLTYYMKNENRRSYTLNSVASDVLKEYKDDIHYTEIPVLHQGTPMTRRKLAKYCLQDALLPGRLLNENGLAAYYQYFARESRILIEYAALAGEAKKVWGALLHHAVYLNKYQIPAYGTFRKLKLYRSRYIGDRTEFRKGYDINPLNFRDEYKNAYQKQQLLLESVAKNQDDDAQLLADLCCDDNENDNNTCVVVTLEPTKPPMIREIPDSSASFNDDYGFDRFAFDPSSSSDSEQSGSDIDDDEEEQNVIVPPTPMTKKRTFLECFGQADSSKKIAHDSSSANKAAKKRKLKAEKLIAENTMPLNDFVDGLAKSCPLENIEGMSEIDARNVIARWLLQFIGDIGEFKGASVLTAIVGYYTNPIVVLDFEGLYASIMRAHNLCFSTGLSLEEVAEIGIENCHQSPTGYWFVNQDVRESIVKIFLEVLAVNRKEAKKGMYDSNPVIAGNANKKQLAIKLLGNSVYGYMGCTIGQIDPMLSIATSITAYGRQMLATCVRTIEATFTRANGYPHDAKVIYGDTDSVMIDFGSITRVEAFEMGEKARVELNKHFIKPINLEFEKIYQPYLLLSAKRYIGVMYESAKFPDKISKVDSKGTEDKRRDSVLLVSLLIKEVTRILMLEKDIEKCCKLTRSVVESLYYGDIDHSLLVMSSELKKFNYAIPQKHSELAKRMTQRNPGNAPTLGDRIQYIVKERDDKTGTEAQQKKRQPDNQLAEDPAYAIEHQIPLNITYYIEKQMKKPLRKIMLPVVGEERFNQLMRPVKHRLICMDDTDEVSAVTPMKRKRAQIDGFFASKTKCLGCRKITSNGSYLCTVCASPDRRTDIRAQYQEKYERALITKNESWTQCYRHIGSSLTEVLCPVANCANFFVRQKSTDSCRRFLKQIERIDAITTDDEEKEDKKSSNSIKKPKVQM